MGSRGDHNTSLSETERGPWEPRHYGFTLNARSTSLGYGVADGERATALHDFVPARFAPAISPAAQRWSVSAALLGAQLYVESRFNPVARSPAGARGIAQFMPGTAAACGLDDPFDADRAIDAQAHLMRDPLRSFCSVRPALAAYNAGAASVRACGWIPAIRETRAYVANILGLLNGAGDPTAPAQARSRSGSCAEPVATQGHAVGDDGRGG